MKLRNKIGTVLAILALIVGLSLLLYPSVSNYWNSIYQSRAVASYSDELAELSGEEYTEIWERAEEYNKSLAARSNLYELTQEQKAVYPETLIVGASTVIGYIEIPSVNVVLPIYHGTAEAILQTAVGHLEWTSLPIGGESTHSVISGHRGLPSAKLFSDLDELVAGDIFVLQVLDRTMTYEVDQIKIVEPQQATDLAIETGKDLCTLVTCTPYGVNTHRLLVRGHRVENRAEAKNVRITSEATQINPMTVAPVVAIPILMVLLIAVLLSGDRRKKREKRSKVMDDKEIEKSRPVKEAVKEHGN